MHRSLVHGAVCLTLLALAAPALPLKTNYKGIITDLKTQGSSLLHPIPLKAELLQLNATLGALANAGGRRADLLLQKVNSLDCGEQWECGSGQAMPLDQPSLPSAAAAAGDPRRLGRPATGCRAHVHWPHRAGQT